MPGTQRRQASFRELYDTTKAPQDIQVAQRISAAVPVNQSMGQLAHGLDRLLPGVERRTQQKIQEQDRADALRALQDRYKNGAREGVENPEFRKNFFRGQSEAYSKAWMQTHYALNASDAFRDLKTHIAENENTPGFDVTRTIDDYVQQSISSVDDPDGIEIFAKKLVPLGEELKNSYDQKALKQLQADAEANIGALTQDALEVGALGTREDLQALIQRGQEMNLSEDHATALVVSAAAQQAVANADPELLEVFAQEDENGLSPLNNPMFRDALMQAHQQATAKRDQKLTLEKVQILDRYNRKVESGSFSLADVREIVLKHPDRFTEGQLASMLAKSRNTAQAGLASQQYTALALNGQLGFGDYSNKEIQAGLNGAFQELVQRYGPDEAIRQFPETLNANGLTFDNWATQMTNGGRVDPESYDGTDVPQRFLIGHSLYQDMSKFSGMAERHIKDEKVKERYEVFQAFLESGETQQGAFANMLRYTQSPISKSDYTSSGMYDEVRSQVNDLSDIPWSWDEMVDGNMIKNKLLSNIDRYARMGLSTDKAVELGRKNFERNYKPLRNTFVYTGGRELPPGADSAVDRHLSQANEAIRNELGSDVNPADLVVRPSLGNPGVMDVYDESGIHPIPGASFYLPSAIQDYQQSIREPELTPEVAVGEFQVIKQEREEAEAAEKARIEAEKGTPAGFAREYSRTTNDSSIDAVKWLFKQLSGDKPKDIPADQRRLMNE